MNEKELREAAECAGCQKKIGEFGIPVFNRVTMQTYGIQLGAVRRQSGLEQMLGNVALAQVMGTQEDMAVPVGEPVTITLCLDCTVEEQVPAILFTEDN